MDLGLNEFLKLETPVLSDLQQAGCVFTEGEMLARQEPCLIRLGSLISKTALSPKTNLPIQNRKKFNSD